MEYGYFPEIAICIVVTLEELRTQNPSEKGTHLHAVEFDVISGGDLQEVQPSLQCSVPAFYPGLSDAWRSGIPR